MAIVSIWGKWNHVLSTCYLLNLVTWEMSFHPDIMLHFLVNKVIVFYISLGSRRFAGVGVSSAKPCLMWTSYWTLKPTVSFQQFLSSCSGCCYCITWNAVCFKTKSPQFQCKCPILDRKLPKAWGNLRLYIKKILQSFNYTFTTSVQTWQWKRV